MTVWFLCRRQKMQGQIRSIPPFLPALRQILELFSKPLLTPQRAFAYKPLTNEDGGAAGRRRLNCLSAFLF
jgi:hypothetical protein